MMRLLLCLFSVFGVIGWPFLAPCHPVFALAPVNESWPGQTVRKFVQPSLSSRTERDEELNNLTTSHGGKGGNKTVMAGRNGGGEGGKRSLINGHLNNVTRILNKLSRLQKSNKSNCYKYTNQTKQLVVCRSRRDAAGKRQKQAERKEFHPVRHLSHSHYSMDTGRVSDEDDNEDEWHSVNLFCGDTEEERGLLRTSYLDQFNEVLVALRNRIHAKDQANGNYSHSNQLAAGRRMDNSLNAVTRRRKKETTIAQLNTAQRHRFNRQRVVNTSEPDGLRNNSWKNNSSTRVNSSNSELDLNLRIVHGIFEVDTEVMANMEYTGERMIISWFKFL